MSLEDVPLSKGGLTSVDDAWNARVTFDESGQVVAAEVFHGVSGPACDEAR